MALGGASRKRTRVSPGAISAKSCPALTLTYADGVQEVTKGGDLFYWPPGHTVRADADTDIVLFSPQVEHTHVIDHMIQKMSG